MPTTAEYLAAQPNFLESFKNGASYADSLFDKAATLQSGRQFAQGDYKGSAATLANNGDIKTAAAVEDMGAKKVQTRYEYLQRAAPVLQQIFAKGGPQAVTGAFEQLAPELKGLGLDDATIEHTRQGLATNPDATLQALGAMAQKKLKFQPDGSGGVYVFDEATGQVVSHQQGEKYITVGAGQSVYKTGGDPGSPPPEGAPVGGAAAPGEQPSAPTSSVAPPQTQAPGLQLVAGGGGPVWRAPNAQEMQQYPGARQINASTGEVRFAPHVGGGGNSTDATSPAEVAAIDPNSHAITAQTGLSVPAFLVLTGEASKLPRDKVTRNKAFKEAQDFANTKGVDISTLASQYKAYKDTLESNIERNNQTKVMEDELVGTIDNLRPVADAAAMGSLRVANVAKLFAGQEFSDPIVSQYSFHLQQLRTELAAYSAATQGRKGSGITVQDYAEAERVIKNGLSSKQADGLQKAVGDATHKMDAVMKRNIYLSNKAVWGLFGVGDNYDRVNGGAPSGRVNAPKSTPADVSALLKKYGH